MVMEGETLMPKGKRKTGEIVPRQLPNVERNTEPFQVYRRRWFILGIFVLDGMTNGLHWNQYLIIASAIQKFYNVSYFWIEWTAIVFSVIYIVLIFPACWLMEQLGLRTVMIIGCVLTCLGAWLKTFSIHRHLFLLGFAGQSIIAVSQVFILPLPSQVAAVWFSRNEVSRACSIAILGQQMGIALGFLLPPLMVRHKDSVQTIGQQLQLMFHIVAGLSTAVLIIVLVFFRNIPPTPPSAAQELMMSSRHRARTETSPFLNSMRHLFSNRNYLLLMLSYGLKIGTLYAVSTLISTIILKHYPGKEKDVGRIGLMLVIAGTVGTFCSGYVLDKTHRFKDTLLIVYACTMLAFWLYTYTIASGLIVIIYVTSSIVGFTMGAYITIGLEFANELTYPESQGVSNGLLNLSANIFGILLTLLYSFLFHNFNDIVSNSAMAIVLLLGTIATATIVEDLRRQKAFAQTRA